MMLKRAFFSTDCVTCGSYDVGHVFIFVFLLIYSICLSIVFSAFIDFASAALRRE